MWHELREEVELKLPQLKALVESFHPLLQKVESSAPDMIETVALAGFLHSAYTGAENILKRIAVQMEEAPPSGGAWHSQLLERMAQPHTIAMPFFHRDSVMHCTTI